MSNNQICGYISLLYSVAGKPLDLWSKHVSLGGKIRRVSDDMLHGDRVIEIVGPHDSIVSTSITAPAEVVNTLNIRLPVLVLIIKNLKSHFKLEVQITDKNQYRKRFSFMTYNLEKLPSINASTACIPLKLEECWNILEINLQTLCRMVYGTDYEALQRMIVYSDCRLRRVYLQDRHYGHDETPIELCNAFLDAYMSKWGINFMEKTCQTEECYTGLSKQRDSNPLKSNNTAVKSKATVLSVKAGSSKDTNDTDKSDNLSALGTIMNLHDSKILKGNYVSLGTLNNEAKMHSNQYVIRQQNWIGRPKFLMNETTVRNKLRETSNNMTEKQENRNKKVIHETGDANSFVKLNHMLHLASPARTSQFLRMHVDKTLFQNNSQNKTEFPKRLYPYRIRDSKDTPVAQKSNVDSVTNTKFRISVTNFPVASKPNLSTNTGISCNKMKNDIIASSDKYLKKKK
ncbi:uncharacterized protein LOC105191588 isoform X2 [Harpegnathos saltator]|uniref:uncharacterized protein LOC105191588 isoform X2 n=1 Tax=Harpegnathos saltator TaxID=610380 RepID=UPI000948EC09|nr:uncharacterized protein LOC105191588 isoform X2 [Harpegnathos saltator]